MTTILSTASPPLRVAVVGLGPMGLHHVRAYADLPNAKLIAVVDIDRPRADETAKTFSCAALYNAGDLIGRVDAVTIATPPEFHAAVSLPLLNAGIACLIEKPLALNEADCQAIAAAAENSNATVAVGHIERFNPAAQVLLAQGLASTSIYSISVERLSPAAGRQVPVDVVSDMMIHDLDIVLTLKGADVVEVTASGVADSHATATLRFADGTTATLVANRKADHRHRELKFQANDVDYVLDFMSRSVTRARQKLAVHEHDALRAEIGDFLQAAAAKTKPRVTLQQAFAAMRVVWRILNAMDKTAS